jgi:hypothetical protein
MISGCGGRAPRRRNRGRYKDVVVLAQPTVSRPQSRDLRRLLRGGPRPGAVVDPGLSHPAAHRLPGHAQLAGHRYRRGRGRGVLGPVLTHQPHRTLPQRRIDLLRHDAILRDSQGGGTEPGALRFGPPEHRGVVPFRGNSLLEVSSRTGNGPLCAAGGDHRSSPACPGSSRHDTPCSRRDTPPRGCAAAAPIPMLRRSGTT